jgi:hypothetical protein
MTGQEISSKQLFFIEGKSQNFARVGNKGYFPGSTTDFPPIETGLSQIL